MPYVVEYLLLVFPGTERIQAANLTLPIISENRSTGKDSRDTGSTCTETGDKI